MPRLLLRTLFIAAMLAAAPTSAAAAVFTAQPPTYVSSGAGPFEWRFAATEPNSIFGGVAYKLSAESGWHRCTNNVLARMSGLSEGSYSVTIADDYSPE